MKFGRLPTRLDPRTLKLRDFIDRSRLPSIPAAYDWSQRNGTDLLYPMLANNRYGDCVFASACHQVMTWTGQNGNEQVILDDEVLDAYKRFTGFDPAKPETDQGACMLDVAKGWRKKPIAGRCIAAFVKIDPEDLELMTIAAFLFGGIWTGWDLPVAWQGQDIWDAPKSWDESKTWGGHAMHLVAASPALFTAITWGERKSITHAGVGSRCREAYVLFMVDTWLKLGTQFCPSGVDGQRLQQALDDISRC